MRCLCRHLVGGVARIVRVTSKLPELPGQTLLSVASPLNEIINVRWLELLKNTFLINIAYQLELGIGRYYTDTGIKPVYTGIFRYRIPVFPKTRYRKIPKYRYRQKPDTEKYRNTGIKKTKYRDFGIFRNNFFLKIQRNFHLIFSKKRVNLTPMEKLLV